MELKQSGGRMVKILRHRSVDEIELASANKFRNYPSVTLKKGQVASWGVFVTTLKLSASEKRRLKI